MHWPVLFVHAEVMVSDFIEDFFEMDTFGGHLDIISFFALENVLSYVVLLVFNPYFCYSSLAVYCLALLNLLEVSWLIMHIGL